MMDLSPTAVTHTISAASTKDSDRDYSSSINYDEKNNAFVIGATLSSQESTSKSSSVSVNMNNTNNLDEFLSTVNGNSLMLSGMNNSEMNHVNNVQTIPNINNINNISNINKNCNNISNIGNVSNVKTVNNGINVVQIQEELKIAFEEQYKHNWAKLKENCQRLHETEMANYKNQIENVVTQVCGENQHLWKQIKSKNDDISKLQTYCAQLQLKLQTDTQTLTQSYRVAMQNMTQEMTTLKTKLNQYASFYNQTANAKHLKL